MTRAVMLLLALAAPNCLRIPEFQYAGPRFAGCFTGPIAQPSGPGTLTIVVEADGNALSGCLVGRDPAFQAPHAGMVLEDLAQARLTATPQGRPPFTLLVERQPAELEIDAVILSVSNEQTSPFVSAPNLPRCAMPTTCADLGIVLPFTPGGAP